MGLHFSRAVRFSPPRPPAETENRFLIFRFRISGFSFLDFFAGFLAKNFIFATLAWFFGSDTQRIGIDHL